MKSLIWLAAFAVQLSLAPAHAQSSWCSTNCGGSSPPWTLYKFYRYPSGFEQQQLSSYDTLDACIGAFDRDTTPYPTTRGMCVFVNGSQPIIRLSPK